MDGFWRHGGKPEDLMGALQAKQDKNFSRVWPTPVSEDVAVEHDREAEITRLKLKSEKTAKKEQII
jgi:hypothetical protein